MNIDSQNYLNMPKMNLTVRKDTQGMWKISKLAWVAVAAISLGLALPATGSAQSAVDEYTEVVPDGGGNTPSTEVKENSGAERSTNSAVGGGDGSTDGSSSSSTGGSGSSGKASGSSKSNGSGAGGKSERGGEADSADSVDEVASAIPATSTGSNLESVYGSDGGGFGLLLPILMGLGLIAAVAVVWKQQRGRGTDV